MMDSLIVRCPSCNKRGTIHLSDKNMVERNSSGIISLCIPSNQICSHDLIIYLDHNREIRDCFATDFCIEIPKLELEGQSGEKDFASIDVFDLDLIKLNLMPLTLTYIIRACIFQKKILILIDEKFLHKHLLNLLKFIFRDSFEIDVSFEENERYKKNKNIFRNYLVISETKVFNDKYNLLNPKAIRVERVFINKFLKERHSKLSLIILRNEILKTFKLANELSKKISKKNCKDIQSIKEILEHLTNFFGIKISLPYIKFLIEIIESNYNISVPMSLKFFLYCI